MREYVCLDYENIHVGCLSINRFGEIETEVSSINGKDTRGKRAVFCKDDSYDPVSQLIWDADSYIYSYQKDEGIKLFVSPNVKTSRDLYRKTGYQIVRDPEKAERIVVPAIPENAPSLKFDFITYASNNGTLTLFSVNRKTKTGAGASQTPGETWQKIKDYFAKYENVVIFQDILFDGNICRLLPKYDEYNDILLRTYPKREYITEENVPIDYPNEINLETLLLWEKTDDEELLARTICTSNWKDYPTTVLVLLKTYHPIIHLYGGQNFEMILKQLGYDRYKNVSNILTGRKIEPEDWNLLQKYLMYKLGLPETGGFTSNDEVSARGMKDMSFLFRKKYAASPLFIDKPVLFENILEMMNIS